MKPKPADEAPGDDDDVPEMAIEALAAAQRAAMESGRPQVIVRDGFLVRVTGSEVIVLKPMPPRIPVNIPFRASTE